jgi:hypothetical protein
MKDENDYGLEMFEEIQLIRHDLLSLRAALDRLIDELHEEEEDQE